MGGLKNVNQILLKISDQRNLVRTLRDRRGNEMKPVLARLIPVSVNICSVCFLFLFLEFKCRELLFINYFNADYERAFRMVKNETMLTLLEE